MTVGSLFAGIGGFELAAQWAGFTPVWSNEIDPFCCKVLRKNFKHRIIEDDIRNIGAHNLETVDILTGGFPCQPFSIAGDRKGKNDDRYLWPEMLRIIGEIKPTYVIGENVGGARQLVDEICSDLEDRGYTTEPINIEAGGIGADHKRERFWFMAYSNSIRLQRSEFRMQENKEQRTINDEVLPSLSFQREKSKDYIPKPYCIGGIDGLPNRVDRIKSLGNAIVPQVALQIFNALKTL